MHAISSECDFPTRNSFLLASSSGLLIHLLFAQRRAQLKRKRNKTCSPPSPSITAVVNGKKARELKRKAKTSSAVPTYNRDARFFPSQAICATNQPWNLSGQESGEVWLSIVGTKNNNSPLGCWPTIRWSLQVLELRCPRVSTPAERWKIMGRATGVGGSNISRRSAGPAPPACLGGMYAAKTISNIPTFHYFLKQDLSECWSWSWSQFLQMPGPPRKIQSYKTWSISLSVYVANCHTISRKATLLQLLWKVKMNARSDVKIVRQLEVISNAKL